jgi:hypothetical protein
MVETLLELTTKADVAARTPESDLDSLDRVTALIDGFQSSFSEAGYVRLEALANAIQQVLTSARDTDAPLSSEARALVFQGTDQIKKLMLSLYDTGHEPLGDDADLIAQLMATLSSAVVAASDVAIPITSPAGPVTENVFQKAARSLRNVGIARTAQRLCQRVLPSWAFDANRLAVCEVDLANWHGARPDAQWNYRWATPEDTELLMQRGLSRAEIDRFFSHGARGTILEIDGELIANNWAVPKQWACFDWIGFDLASDEIYGASSFVAPSHRGQRIHHQTRNFLYGSLATEGYQRSITLIETLNKSSLRASAGKPRQYHGHLSYVRVLGLVVYKLNGRWGAGFWNKSHPLMLTYDMVKASTVAPQTPGFFATRPAE